MNAFVQDNELDVMVTAAFEYLIQVRAVALSLQQVHRIAQQDIETAAARHPDHAASSVATTKDVVAIATASASSSASTSPPADLPPHSPPGPAVSTGTSVALALGKAMRLVTSGLSGVSVSAPPVVDSPSSTPRRDARKKRMWSEASGGGGAAEREGWLGKDERVRGHEDWSMGGMGGKEHVIRPWGQHTEVDVAAMELDRYQPANAAQKQM